MVISTVRLALFCACAMWARNQNKNTKKVMITNQLDTLVTLS